MTFVHEMFRLMVLDGTDIDTLLREYAKFDPATPENGNKTISERYQEWLKLCNKEMPITNND